MDLIGRYLDVFCVAAIDKGDGTSEQDSLFFACMQKAYSKLNNHPQGLEHFAKLLNHESNWVKLWVAVQLLSSSENDEALLVVNNLSADESILGVCASTTLSEYKNGKLQGPFCKET